MFKNRCAGFVVCGELFGRYDNRTLYFCFLIGCESLSGQGEKEAEGDENAIYERLL
jgi:hypothetical protein